MASNRNPGHILESATSLSRARSNSGDVGFIWVQIPGARRGPGDGERVWTVFFSDPTFPFGVLPIQSYVKVCWGEDRRQLMRTLAHVTHEAVQKVGGIGAVLQGLFTSRAYIDAVDRTILVGPLFTTEGSPDMRLGRDGEILYSSVDGVARTPAANVLREVERKFDVDIVYGRRTFSDARTGVSLSPEVLLIDVSHINLKHVNAFKFKLWDVFGISSTEYERFWDFEQYVRLAEPALACLAGLGAVGPENECVILAHEFMGMPTALAGLLDPAHNYRTLFYAHEVAPIRKVVEDHPGHDTMFYNVLKQARRDNLYMEDVFGDQRHFFKHALVHASRFCDNILAVGDEVVNELRFLDPAFRHVDIDLCYNGLPAYDVSMDELRQSQERLRHYADNLLGFRPDYLFSHVTRTTVSKGLWRDLRVLEYVEKRFRETGKTAVLFVLSTEVPPRRGEDVRNMERWWKWPVAHREGMPDLSGGEAMFYAGVQEFNARARQVKVVFVNQFGWDRASCGLRMPEDMEFFDIRRGTHVEFGQSIYEPFGIAQLEPLSFGALCVVTNVCGCAGFVDSVTARRAVPNVIVADYTNLGGEAMNLDELLQMDREQRDHIETVVAGQVARRLLEHLPQDEAAHEVLRRRGCELAVQMSWEVVARDYLLPALDRACRKHRVVQVA